MGEQLYSVQRKSLRKSSPATCRPYKPLPGAGKSSRGGTWLMVMINKSLGVPRRLGSPPPPGEAPTKGCPQLRAAIPARLRSAALGSHTRCEEHLQSPRTGNWRCWGLIVAARGC